MYTGPDRRTEYGQATPITLAEIEASFASRMDKQDEKLEELRTLLLLRNAQDDDLRPTLHEMVLLWRASKIMIPVLVGLMAAVWAFVSWAKDHLKL